MIKLAIEEKVIGQGGKDLTEAEKQTLPESYPENYLVQADKDAWFERTIKERGSKATEKSEDRDKLNNSFAKVEGIEMNSNTVSVKDENGIETGNVTYKLREGGADIESSGNLGIMTANTINDNPEISIIYDRTDPELIEKGVIDGFNLGLYRRAQIDIQLSQGLEEVQASIKGTTTTYKKGAKNKTTDMLVEEQKTAQANNQEYNIEDHIGEFINNVWTNVGVSRFDLEYIDEDKAFTYSQPVYRADYMYTNTEDSDKELKMYFLYKIALQNQSGFTNRIHEVVEYFDSRFSTSKEDGFEIYIGKNAKGEKDDNTNIITNIKSEQEKVSNGKRKFYITLTGLDLGGYETKYLYIKFPLNRDKIAETLNADKPENDDSYKFSSVAEITSYTTFENGKYYAAVDRDAVANNVNVATEEGVINVTDPDRYEDDSDKAADAKLYIAEARKIEGFAFEDKALQAQLDKNIREGNGAYDSDETLIPDMKVELYEVKRDANGNIIKDQDGNVTVEDNPAQLITDEKDDNNWTSAVKENLNDGEIGKYSFEGFTPGTYIVRFTWGGENSDYKVTDYKATIVDETEYNAGEYFYRGITDKTNKSRATDDTNIRREIDEGLRTHEETTAEETKTVEGTNYATKVGDLEKEIMKSNTQPMTFDVEWKGTDIPLFDLTEDKKLQFVVSGMNLGIIRRPIQSIEIEKRVSNVTVKYSSEEAIINADIDEDGNITGEHNNIAYIGTSANRRQAQLKVELDNEVLGNSGVDVTYEFIIKNTSEQDYTSINFQRFGTLTANDKGELVKLTPSKIMDYMGNEATCKVCKENTDNGWKLVTAKQEEVSETSEFIGNLVSDDVKNSEKIKETKMYKTENLANTAMSPEETTTLKMVVEKRLTSTEDSNNITNQVEIIQVNKPKEYNSGSPVTTEDGSVDITFGNYVPATTIEDISNVDMINALEPDDSMAETVIIMPSTGGDRNYIPEIAIGLTVLVALAGGIYFIKKIVTK